MATLQMYPKRLPLLSLFLALVVLIAGTHASADVDLPGIPGLSADGATQEPGLDNVAKITQRAKELAAERAKIAIQIQQQSTDATIVAHLTSADERLVQINQTLEAQLHLAQLLALQPEAVAEQYKDESSILQLNALYEQLASAEEAVRNNRERLQTARKNLQSVEDRVRDKKAALADASNKNRPQRERSLQKAELAAREAREQVNLATLELTAAKRETQSTDTLQDRITELRERLAQGEGANDGSIGTLLERESTLERAKATVERQLTTADLRLAAAKQRYA